MIIAAGLYEPREELFVASYIGTGDVVVDVGANLGLYTVAAANLGAHVYAFEPSSQARLALAQNVALVGNDAVEIFPAALGERREKLRLTMGLDVSNHLIDFETREPSEVVDVMALDELTSGESPPIRGPIALIKIDAEGFDDKVLRGGEATLLRDKPVVIVETWGDGVLRGWLEDRGFIVFRYDLETSQLLEYPNPWNRQANFIAVHNDILSTVQKRLATADSPRPGLPRIMWSWQAQRSVLQYSNGSTALDV